MTHLVDKRAEELLTNTKISSIATLNGLITLRSTDSISTALKLLADKQITGAPVIDENNTFSGFVDVLDLAIFVAYTFQENFQKHPHLYNPKELRERFQIPVKEVINCSKRNPFTPVHSEESVSFLIDNFLKSSAHRVPIVNNGNIGIISQSDVIKFLSQNLHFLTQTISKTIGELGLDNRPVVTVSNNAPLIDAFTLIVNNNISGLAIVDFRDGKLINNLSASDLKGITEQSFHRLEAQVHQILTTQGALKLPAVTCRSFDNIGLVMTKISETGVHRVYVVDDHYKPVGVITLSDIINLFAHPPASDL